MTAQTLSGMWSDISLVYVPMTKMLELTEQQREWLQYHLSEELLDDTYSATSRKIMSELLDKLD